MTTNISPTPDHVNPPPPPDSTSLAALQPFFRGLCMHPVLLIAVLLILGIAWGLLGRYYGVPDLFWHQNVLVQLLAGAGSALLLGHVCFVSYLLDGEQPWLKELPRDAPSRGWRRRVSALVNGLASGLVPAPRDPASEPEPAAQWRQLRWYLSVTWLPLLGLLLLPALVYVSRDWPWTGDDRDYWTGYRTPGTFYLSEGKCLVLGIYRDWCLVLAIGQRWPLLVGVAIAALIARSYVLGFHLFYTLVTARWGLFLPTLAGRLPRQPWLHLAIVLVFGALLLAFRGEPLTLCLLLGLWIATHGAVVGLFRTAAVGPEERWKHLLAAAGFGTCFLLYELLFLVYWAGSDPETTDLISPALALCLLLALAAAVYGFLRFHFRAWYPLIALALLVAGVLVNGLVPQLFHFPKLALPGLDYAGDQVLLADSDFQAVKDDPFRSAEDRDEKLGVLYHKLRHRLLVQRAAHSLENDLATAGPENPPGGEAIVAEYDKLRRELLDLEYRRLRNWRGRLGGNERPRMVVVAVSGGANRSALWTAVVLSRLERAFRQLQGAPVFPHHVRVLTGASGGMVGAAYYVANTGREGGPGRWDDDAQTEFVERVGRDHLTPIAQRVLFVDAPMLWLPVENTRDRGRALEESWDRHLDGALERSFRDLARGEAEGWRPSLILSPMLVEDGRLLLISNLYLPFLSESTGSFLLPDRPLDSDPRPPAPSPSSRPGDQRPRPEAKQQDRDLATRYRYSLSALEFFQLFPRRDDFRLSTGVRMSATFPYASPAADLPTVPRRRVVDAGYYDNYGVGVAASWIYHYRDWLRLNTSGVVLIQIRDNISDDRRLFPSEREEGWRWSRGIEWLTGPLVGAKSAMESVSSFRNDGQVQFLSDHFFRRTGDPDWFTTVVFDCREEVAVNWYLTREEIQHMRRGFDPYQDRDGNPVDPPNLRSLNRLLEWWTRQEQPPGRGVPAPGP